MVDIQKIWDEVIVDSAWQIESEFLELLRIMHEHRVTSVLEVGCYKGGTARGFIELGATVLSIDVNPQPEAVKLTQEMPDKFSILVGTSDDFHDVLSRHKFDMLFIDGDHTEEWARKDYENLVPYIRPGGLVVFHDIANTELHAKQNCHVWKVWEAVKAPEYTEILSGDIWGGIGVKYL